MPASKAQQKAVTKYMKANYDEIKVRVEKGQKDSIQSHAVAHGESVNGFIGRAISETMERDGGTASSSPPQATETAQGDGVVSLPSLPSDTSEAAQRAAERTGETVAAFVPRAKARYTFADCLTWEEDDRIEIIDGEAVMIAPPLRIHQEIVAELTRQFGNYLEGKRCKVYPAPFGVRLFERDGEAPEDVDTVVEPDISVVCDKNKLDDYGCKGAPDLVIEVLSPSTRRHDRLVKLGLYQRAGVREYWIVNPEEQTVQVFTLDGGGSLRIVEEYGRGDVARVNVLEGCFIDLGKVFNEGVQ